jgi:GGDEF domain-containing protein
MEVKMAAMKPTQGKTSAMNTKKKTAPKSVKTSPSPAAKVSKAKVTAASTPASSGKAVARLQLEIQRQVDQHTLKLTSVVERLERELAAQKRINREIREQVVLDELTQLFNRRGFLLFSEHHLKLARRASLELVFLFVQAEGSYAESSKFVSQKEQMIKLTGELIRSVFRTTDILGRLDDDSMGVLAVAAEKGSAKIIVMRLREKIQSFVHSYNAETNNKHTLKFRVGIMRLDPRGISAVDDLIEKSNGLFRKCREHDIKPTGEILTLASYNRGDEVAPTAELMVLPLWDGTENPAEK